MRNATSGMVLLSALGIAAGQFGCSSSEPETKSASSEADGTGVSAKGPWVAQPIRPELAQSLRPPAAVPGEGRDVRGEQLGSAQYKSALRGGTGGTLQAFGAPNGVIYAIASSTGTLVDNVAFAFYQPSGADNKFRSGDFIGTISLGGSGGTAHGWEYCPSFTGSVGLVGDHNGTYVTAIGMVCGDLITAGGWTFTTEWGGSSGLYSFSDICASHYLNTGFDIYAGIYVDGIATRCQASQ